MKDKYQRREHDGRNISFSKASVIWHGDVVLDVWCLSGFGMARWYPFGARSWNNGMFFTWTIHWASMDCLWRWINIKYLFTDLCGGCLLHYAVRILLSFLGISITYKQSSRLVVVLPAPGVGPLAIAQWLPLCTLHFPFPFLSTPHIDLHVIFTSTFRFDLKSPINIQQNFFLSSMPA
jgi:hypothetical protein